MPRFLELGVSKTAIAQTGRVPDQLHDHQRAPADASSLAARGESRGSGLAAARLSFVH